jgi:hypothetical protein
VRDGSAEREGCRSWGWKGARGHWRGEFKPVARKEQHTLDGNVVIRASLPRLGVRQTQHVTQCLDNAETSQTHERLMKELRVCWGFTIIEGSINLLCANGSGDNSRCAGGSVAANESYESIELPNDD